MTGVCPVTPDGREFVIDPPADSDRSPELLIEPALNILLTAFNDRERVLIALETDGNPPVGKAEEINAPDKLVMLLAAIVAIWTEGLVEKA
jgi:hypothetical protein